MRMEFRSRLIGVLPLAVFLLLLPEAVRAAPQVLGLVATRGAMPLQCDAGSCVGFLSTFCLEEERHPPSSRAAYKLAPNSEITLVVETHDGRTLRLPGNDYLSFQTRLDYTSVLARVPMARLTTLLPANVSVHIGSLASLIPIPVAGDTDLHSPAELAIATGAYRKTGQRFFDNGGEKSETVSMVTHLINALPRQGRMDKKVRDIAYRDTLGGDGAVRPAARDNFRKIVRSCEAILESTAARYNMRDCLEYRHEVMQTETNRKFWKALGGV
jgi:hypothetical protein